MIYYLYVKQHNQTGLKYLGQTKQNPYKYKGSGKYWKHHLKYHGNDVSTEVLATFDNKDDLGFVGKVWSEWNNIVDSNEWANLKNETGDGNDKGNIPWNKGKTGIYTEESKKKMRLAKQGHKLWLGRKHSKESCEKMSKAKLGCIPWNKGLNKDTDERVAQYGIKQSQTKTRREQTQFEQTKGICK